MYLDLLPEEIIQIIWKFIYNDNLEGIPTARRLSGLCCCGGENLWWDNLRLTVGIKKKKGYYYDILKEKYNVTLFEKTKMYRVSQSQAIENFSRKSFPLAYSYEAEEGRWRSTFKMVGHSKKDLQEMLRENGYVLYDPTEYYTFIPRDVMYKSWTRQRLIKELMSF
tara:strand:+ start:59 stop:556 length:498 start_codon:yes stop_codon:yes gene_type:complete